MKSSNNIQRLNKTQRGFSLLELMIVMVIFTLILGAGAPSLVNMINRNAQQQVTSDITLGLLYARSEAIKRNTETRFFADNTNWSVAISNGGAFIPDQSHEMPDDMLVTGPSFISFFGNGRARATGGNRYFEVEIDGSDLPKRCIFVNATGVSKVLVDVDDDGNCANG